MLHTAGAAQVLTEERCSIAEWLRPPADTALSIARARVAPGVTTRWHALEGVAERYLVLEGTGRAEVGDDLAGDVGPGDIVLIPPGARQRIRNTGDRDLVFLALCTPPFELAAYRDAEG